MARKQIPVLGEPYLGDEPAPVRVLKVTWGVSSGSPDVVYTSDSDGAAVDDLVELNSTNIDVIDIGWFVEEAFTASAAVTLGISTDADGFAAAASVGSTTVDTYTSWMSKVRDLSTDAPASIVAFVQGYRPVGSSASDNIAGTGGAVTAAAGKLAVYVKYIKHG